MSKNFFLNNHVAQIAKDLVGKVLYYHSENGLLAGRIVETEAYHQSEKGCHAYGGKLTIRTAPLFKEGGIIYVYLCYGIHHLFNIVTGEKDSGEAVLIRAVEPLENMEIMKRNRDVKGKILTNGPGKWTKAFGITISLNNKVLQHGFLWIEDYGYIPEYIVSTKRIGIDYAGNDALLNWRFYLKNNNWVSLP